MKPIPNPVSHRIVPLATSYTFGSSSYAYPRSNEFFDNLLGTPCQPGSDNAGVIRCLPLPFSSTFYTDAGCNELAGWQQLDECPIQTQAEAKYITIGHVDRCGSNTYEVKEQVFKAWQKFGETCEPVDLRQHRGRFYRLGLAVASFKFEEAKLSIITLPGQGLSPN